MKLLRLFSATCVVALVGMMGCEKESPSSVDLSAPEMAGDVLAKVSANGTELSTVELIAAKSFDVGDVSFDDVDTDNDGTDDALLVTYETADGWKLVSTNLWVGPSLSDMPDTRKGDPKPRKFPYQSRRICDSIWTVTIPFEALGYQCGDTTTWYVAANAVVRKVSGHRRHRTESAWSGDTRFRDKRGHWATYTTITIDCDQYEEPPVVITKKSYAFNPDLFTICFPTLFDFSVEPPLQLFNEWGWTNMVPEYGTYSFTLYADAGDEISCDATSGLPVGTVSLSYTESGATVTVTAAAGHGLSDVYVHFGPAPFPEISPGVFTLDPASYANQATGLGNVAEWSTTVTGVAGPAFLIVRAEVAVLD